MDLEGERARLGKRVERARLERGWSKEQAARIAGVSSITWKKVEDGLSVHDAKRYAILRAVGLAGEPGPVTREELIEASDLPDWLKREVIASLPPRTPPASSEAG